MHPRFRMCNHPDLAIDPPSQEGSRFIYPGPMKADILSSNLFQPKTAGTEAATL